VTHRWQWLRDSARDETQCTGCGGEFPPGYICWAHSNLQEHGRGASHKAHDLMGAYLCQTCHDLLDGRNPKLSKPQKRMFFLDAWAKTIVTLIDKGVFDAPVRNRR
jgi:hypothetical protein